MKRPHRILVLGPIAALLVITVHGQPTTTQRGSTSLALESTEQEKHNLYSRFLETFKKNSANQASAYKVACDYLERFPQDTPKTRYLREWTSAYEKMMRKIHVSRLINEGNYDEAFAFAKNMLSAAPNDFETLYILVQGGVLAFTHGNKTVMPDAANHAKTALQLLESGQNTDQKTEKTLEVLNVSLGIFYLASDPAQSAVYFSRVLQLESVKNDPYVYGQIVDAVIGAEYYPLLKELQSRSHATGQEMSAETVSIRFRFLSVIDFLIDVLARAVALAGSDSRFEQAKAEWMNKLTNFYKFRNSGYETGLPELIKGILNEPFPRLGQYYY